MLKHVLAIAALAVISDLPTAPIHLAHADGQPKPNAFWWPERLNLQPLRDHGAASNPYGADFDYGAAFAKVDLEALKADITAVMTTSQDWWPADWGHYGPFFIRMAWHAAGTYRTGDGRGGSDGGQLRFEPLNSWPDNTNLDKARRLLWPVKKKYGRSVSWGDLMVLTGTIAMESMGFKTYGFAGGRADDWEPDLVYWGPEASWLADERHTGDRKLQRPLGATQMGLIYVNPEGPNGNPDPWAAAKDIRTAFGRMAMSDEETVALIAGGHTFGKTHGAHKPEECLGAEPGGANVEEQGLGWKNSCGKGNAEDTVTSGLEGAWTATPTQWSMQYLDLLFNQEWVLAKSPAGATQWVPSNKDATTIVPDAHVAGKLNQPIMLTTDLALRYDPDYEKVARRFLDNPEDFELAFAKAWFKLTHRDMGPRARYVGADAPDEALIWQDPVPTPTHPLVDARDIARLKADILDTGLSVPALVRAAWASAASYRDTDMRGGTNGGRVRLAPQTGWAVNTPGELAKVLAALEDVRDNFNASASDGKRISMADMVVLGGAAAIEVAAKAGGYDLIVPFTPGRGDATAAMTDVRSVDALKPEADGFRNYVSAAPSRLSPAQRLVDKADTLALTVPEMTVLLGGLRALDANTGGAKHGVFTDQPGVLSNDFFVNLLDLGTSWSASETTGLYEGRAADGTVKWTATEVDLVFGSNSELRTIAEVYAFDDARDKFAKDFVAAWVKVMNHGRF